MLRSLRRDFRDYPATMTICTLWVIVYAAMLATSIYQGDVSSWRGWLLGTPGGERFGDMSLRELARGQLWRTLTSTFVHYGLLHVGMNLFFMYQLGSLIEEWYGPWLSLALYVFIGIGGNAVSALIRYALGSKPYIHSGGGSTVLLGFVGLCAVVGWRAQTRMGDFLRGQMIAILIYTAVLGVALPVVNYFVPMPLIDNWGHAGGALVGAAVGFAHRWLERSSRRKLAPRLGAAAVALLVASSALQVRVDRLEAPERARQRLDRARGALASLNRSTLALARVEYQYKVECAVAQRARKIQPGMFVRKDRLRAMSVALSELESTRPTLGNGATRDAFAQVRALLERARSQPPDRRDMAAFDRSFGQLVLRMNRQHQVAGKQYAALATPARMTPGLR